MDLEPELLCLPLNGGSDSSSELQFFHWLPPTQGLTLPGVLAVVTRDTTQQDASKTHCCPNLGINFGTHSWTRHRSYGEFRSQNWKKLMSLLCKSLLKGHI